MDKQLKTFALEYVKLHDDLQKEQKLAIGEFIMEASDDQVMFMLATGEVKDNLTQEDLETIKEFDAGVFKQVSQLAVGKDYDVGVQTGAKGALASVAVAAAVAVAAVAAYKRFFSKAAKACAGKGGMDKTNCMNKFKKQAQAAKVKTLQAGISKCKDDKCRNKLKTKVNAEKAKMGAL